MGEPSSLLIVCLRRSLGGNTPTMLCHFTPRISDGAMKGRIVSVCDCCHIASVLKCINELTEHVPGVVPGSADDLVEAIELD